MKRRVLFGIYCGVMLWLLFGQRMDAWQQVDYLQQLKENVNLQPLDTIRRFLWVLQNSPQPGLRTHALINLAGNVGMFIPLGIFLPAVWKRLRRLWLFLLCILGIIVAVELIQLVTLLGKCDVDDVLLNTIGALLGFGGYMLVTKFQEK